MSAFYFNDFGCSKKFKKRRRRTNTIQTGIKTSKTIKKASPLSLESTRPSLVSKKRIIIIRIEIAQTKHMTLVGSSVIIIRNWAITAATAQNLQKTSFGLDNLLVGN